MNLLSSYMELALNETPMLSGLVISKIPLRPVLFLFVYETIVFIKKVYPTLAFESGFTEFTAERMNEFSRVLPSRARATLIRTLLDDF